MSDDIEQDPGPETVSLGRFDPLELPIILETLRDHGIFAMTKSPLEKADNEQYGVFGKGREQLLVDRDRAVDARRIIDAEVRPQMAEMGESLAGSEDVDFEEEGLMPLGWLEPDAARELLSALRAADIRARPEYALDEPPPPYARGDGRVRVHVEELFLDDAAQILETEVREALGARGVTFADPLLGEDE